MDSRLNAEKLNAQSRAFRVMKTVEEMCIDRKMPIPAEWCARNLDEFRNRYCNAEGRVEYSMMQAHCFADRCERPEDNGRLSMIVHFDDTDPVSAAVLRGYAEGARRDSVSRVLIVHKGKLAATARQALLAITAADGLRVEVIEEERLVVNITRHELVPKHEPLTERELNDMLKAHSLQLHMLPRILATDPVAVYFGLERGQVVKITRKSETAGVYVSYRQVV